jgi:predicted nucleotidyltransferase
VLQAWHEPRGHHRPAANRARRHCAHGVTHAARARGDARADSGTDIMIEIDPEARIGVTMSAKDFISGC